MSAHPASTPATPPAWSQAARAAAQRIAAFAGPQPPKVALVLGSGLGSYAELLRNGRSIGYEEIGFPVSRVVGHAGRLFVGQAPTDGRSGVEVFCMQGRVHAYEGHELETVVLPVRALILSGVTTVILTNAAGGLGEGLVPGDLVLVRDHLNLLGGSPLRGENDDQLGPRFPDMTTVYDKGLRALAERAAQARGMRLPSGVYAGCLGPQYETPAEIRMLRTLGADLVGMSTVPEAIAARHLGARVLAISCVTNLAAGTTGEPLSHDEVTETAARVRQKFITLLDDILAGIAAG